MLEISGFPQHDHNAIQSICRLHHIYSCAVKRYDHVFYHSKRYDSSEIEFLMGKQRIT